MLPVSTRAVNVACRVCSQPPQFETSLPGIANPVMATVLIPSHPYESASFNSSKP